MLKYTNENEMSIRAAVGVVESSTNTWQFECVVCDESSDEQALTAVISAKSGCCKAINCFGLSFWLIALEKNPN